MTPGRTSLGWLASLLLAAGVGASACRAAPHQADRPAAAAPPATLPGQDAPARDQEPPKDETPREKVTIRDRVFRLELSADPESRARGLAGRESIDADGGMLFAYPSERLLSYWMKDCLVDMDIAYLDHEGRITAMYTMRRERPRGADESLWAYESRLRHYSSRRRAQFAIELRAGTIKELELRIGERIELDVPRLERLAR